MSVIKRDNNWRHVDQLNGKDLKEGERLSLVFPDGKEYIKNIVVKTHTSYVQDMNTKVDVSHRYAGFYTTYHGIKIFVPIVGLTAKRLRKK